VAAKWERTKYPGVRFYKHDTRKHGVQFDKYFAIRFQYKGERKEEGLGWASEGWTVDLANEKLAELKRAARTGDGPQRLHEAREAEELRRQEEEKQKTEEAKAAKTFGKFFEDTYLPHAKSYKKEDTWGTEERLYRLWIKPVIGDLPMRAVGLKHLKAIDWRMQKGQREDTAPDKSKPRPLSPKSRAYALSVIRQVWNHGKRYGITSGDWPGKVMNKEERPRVNNQKVRFLSQQEASRLLEELRHTSTNLHDQALLSLHTGLRAGEIFTLTWGHVDLAKGTLFLPETKNGESRTAYLTPETKVMLANRLELAKMEDGHSPASLVFIDRKGNKIKEPSAAFSRAVDRVGLNDSIVDKRQKITFHSLRHTYASWLVEAGVSLYVVSKLLGHKSLKMTARYAHVGENAERRAARALAEHIKAPAELHVVKGGE
jgi:integrase